MTKVVTFTIAPAVAGVLPAPTQSVGVCQTEVLPLDIRNQISTEFPSWRIQEASDLNPTARGIWEAYAQARECPGIAAGQFEGGAALSYTVLLVSRNHSKTGNRFLIFGHRTVQTRYELKFAEKSETAEAGNFFVRRIQISKFFNQQWIKKLGIGVEEGILLVDAGEREYEADDYYWTQGRYWHESVDY